MNWLKQMLGDSRRAPLFVTAYTLVTSGLMYLFSGDYATWFFVLLLLSLVLVYLGNMNRWLKLGLAVLVIAVIVPLVGQENGALLNVSITMAMNVVLALGLNLVVGFAGLLDLGYIAFFATGAYVWAVFASPQAAKFLPHLFANMPNGLSGNYFWIFLPIAVLAAAGMGLTLGMPVLRLRGDYLAIVTLGFGEIIRIVLNNLDKPLNITNGPRGITPVAPPALFGYSLDKPVDFYFIALLIMLLVIVVMGRIEHSRLGRAWAAMREDDIAARAMGIPLVKMKLMAFATGAAFSGAMGMIFAVKQTFVSPESFTFMESIAILAMVILGGLASIPGVIIGAVTVTLLRMQILTELANWMSQFHLPPALNLANYQPLIFGLILIFMMRYRRHGILPPRQYHVDIEALMAEPGPANTPVKRAKGA